jgi:Mn2+/Fe2+ NRAMP family transporter
MKSTSSKSVRIGAAFLMATSAIGPGFLTQTTVFTVQLGASFGFVILLSVLLDLVAQVNIWSIITASGKSATHIGNQVVSGLGHLLTILVFIGGLAFNIGNVAGAGLGLEVCTGIPAAGGAVLSAALAAALFLSPDSGKAMDTLARILGLGMILLCAWVAFSAHPPVQEMLLRSVVPEKFDWKAVLTLVGGTVGGYICFAGAHRLLEAGIQGPEQVRKVQLSALTGIGIATIMRILLFVAALGVVASGASIDRANPPASVFQLAAGAWGYRFFGIVMWSAAITSVIGATFTSFSFLLASFPRLTPYKKAGMLLFLLFSTAVFLFYGNPVKILVAVGALNGLILPVALAAMLLAAQKTSIVGDYKHSRWLNILGWIVVSSMGWVAIKSFSGV